MKSSTGNTYTIVQSNGRYAIISGITTISSHLTLAEAEAVQDKYYAGDRAYTKSKRV